MSLIVVSSDRGGSVAGEVFAPLPGLLVGSLVVAGVCSAERKGDPGRRSPTGESPSFLKLPRRVLEKVCRYAGAQLAARKENPAEAGSLFGSA